MLEKRLDKMECRLYIYISMSKSGGPVKRHMFIKQKTKHRGKTGFS